MLNRLKFKGCQAGYGCKRKSEKCVVSDDRMGFENSELIHACGVMEPADLEKRQDAFKQAEELAEKNCRLVKSHYQLIKGGEILPVDFIGGP